MKRIDADGVPVFDVRCSVVPLKGRMRAIEEERYEPLKHYVSRRKLSVSSFVNGEVSSKSSKRTRLSQDPISNAPLLRFVLSSSSEILAELPKEEQEFVQGKLDGKGLVSVGLMMEEYLKHQLEEVYVPRGLDQK